MNNSVTLPEFLLPFHQVLEPSRSTERAWGAGGHPEGRPHHGAGRTVSPISEGREGPGSRAAGLVAGSGLSGAGQRQAPGCPVRGWWGTPGCPVRGRGGRGGPPGCPQLPEEGTRGQRCRALLREPRARTQGNSSALLWGGWGWLLGSVSLPGGAQCPRPAGVGEASGQL